MPKHQLVARVNKKEEVKSSNRRLLFRNDSALARDDASLLVDEAGGVSVTLLCGSSSSFASKLLGGSFICL